VWTLWFSDMLFSLLGPEPRSSVPESVTSPNSSSSCHCH
jgi:hypothetical protein